MTAWWDQVLESPAFLGPVNSGLGGVAQARGAYTRGVDQFLTQAHLPTREDIVRLLRVATQLEDRLLAQEDLLLRLGDDARSAEKAALEARIQSAEAQIALNERLAAIEGLLQNSAAGAAPALPPARRGR